MNQDTEDYDKALYDKVIHPNLALIKPVLDIIGVGLHERDAYYLSISQELFLRDTNVMSCRFWGKLFGLHQNYWVFEVELTEEAIAGRSQSMSKTTILSDKNPSSGSLPSEVPQATISNISTAQPDVQKPEIPSLPQSTCVPTPETPSETFGEGSNRFLYYVSNKPFGNTWHELPLVTPKDICVSKKIKKALTGDLTHQVISYPTFNTATEAHLLRALIARITASTFVAPLNYWVTRKPKDVSGEEEEEVCVCV